MVDIKLLGLRLLLRDVRREEVIEGIKIKRFGGIYSIYLYTPFYCFRNRKKFDLVVDEVHGIPFFTPLYVRSVPILVLIHEVAGEIWDYMYPKPVSYLGKFLEKVYLRLYRAKHFWSDAQATIDELIENGIDRRKCISIPCPSNAKVLSKLPEKNKETTFVWVSRIVKMKGIEDVIEAFYIYNKKNPNSKLEIIGNGKQKYVNYLKNKIRQKEIDASIKFHGYLDEKQKLEVIRKSHLLLHASVKEGWGIVVIEAASQATPSIVYNVPGLTESVKDSETGIVLKKNDSSEMASAMEMLISNKSEYRKYQENCLKWARSLNWDDESKKSLSLLDKLVSKKKKINY